MDSKINVADFCKKHQVDRNLLNYQLSRKRIERDENKRYNEQQMLKLLNIRKEDNVEIQHLKEQINLLKEQLAQEQLHNLKMHEKFENLKNNALQTAIGVCLNLHPITQPFAHSAQMLVGQYLKNKTKGD